MVPLPCVPAAAGFVTILSPGSVSNAFPGSPAQHGTKVPFATPWFAMARAPRAGLRSSRELLRRVDMRLATAEDRGAVDLKAKGAALAKQRYLRRLKVKKDVDAIGVVWLPGPVLRDLLTSIVTYCCAPVFVGYGSTRT